MCGTSEAKKVVVRGTIAAVDFGDGNRAALDFTTPRKPVVLTSESSQFSFGSPEASVTNNGDFVYVWAKFGSGRIDTRLFPELRALMNVGPVGTSRDQAAREALALL